MIEAEWWEYDSLDELADAVAGDVGFIIESAVDARDASLIAVPGGKTGPAIFTRLAKQKLPWKKVTVIPTDDRLVAVDSELSNVRGLARAFLPLGARVVPLTSEAAADYKLAGNAADARLQDLPWPPDLVWLGMGADGHVASIFPGADLQPALDAPKPRRAIGTMPDPLPQEAPVARVTLTRAAILSARTVLITITGQAPDKLVVTQRHDVQSRLGPNASTKLDQATLRVQARGALAKLGYTRKDAAKAVGIAWSRVGPNVALDLLVREAIKSHPKS
jgi:6-phosphogluconolactonase